MKKTLCLLLCLLMMFSFAACGGEKEKEEEQTIEYTYEIGMLTAAPDVSIDDENYTQAVWEGVRQFAEKQGVTYKYYESETSDQGGQLARLSAATAEGAEIIVAAGPELAETIQEAQTLYPDVKFIYVDGPMIKAGDNCIGIGFDSLQAGFLAGYGAVYDGLDDLGFLANGETDEAKAYFYGFLQGCNEAAERFGRYAEIKYHYGNGEAAEQELQDMAKDWYDNGTDAIFTYGADVFAAVETVAAKTEKIVIGSNTGKAYSETVITSAKKHYEEAIVEQLQRIYDGTFAGGKTIKLGAESGKISLDMSDSKFRYFNEYLYNQIYKELADGTMELVSAEDAETIEKLVEKQRMYYIRVLE